MARKKLEEPEKWITVNGQHLPVYAGGRIGAPGQSEPDRKAKTTKTKKQDANQTYKKKELMDGGKKTNTAYKYGEGHITEYADEVKPEFHGGESYKYSAHKTGEASSKYFKTEKEAQEYLAGGKKNDLQQNVDALNEFHDKAWKSGADKDALRTLIKQRADAMPDGTVLARVKQETSSTYTSKGIMQQTETKMSKLYKINGQWSRYKDGSGKIDDIASEVIHGSGKLQTLDAARLLRFHRSSGVAWKGGFPPFQHDCLFRFLKS